LRRLSINLNQFLTSSGIATLFSIFIYMHHFHLENQILEIIFGFLAIYLILISDRKIVTLSGFFIGLYWFFWVGFSLQYYGFPYLIPLGSIIFGIGYSLLFFGVSFYKSIFLRAILLSLTPFFEPFGFDWFKPQILFINSPFGTEVYQFASIVFSIALFRKYVESKNSLFIYLSITILLSAINYKNFGDKVSANSALKIDLVQTDLPQEDKWIPENQTDIVNMNLSKIEESIKNGFDVVVIPESAFPLFLNRRGDLLNYLKVLSYDITIWTGGLLAEDGKYYNSSFIFQNGDLEIAKKVVLVPFGEYIPLPKFLSNWINEIFFGRAEDFTPAVLPTDIDIYGEIFRNAICYEGTSEVMFRDKPKFMIVISNNGWFLPSIEPTLQRLLMQHYSNIYGTTIFHSANREGTGVIYPKY
jgi:apolipoprotein N-acyltransferase